MQCILLFTEFSQQTMVFRNNHWEFQLTVSNSFLKLTRKYCRVRLSSMHFSWKCPLLKIKWIVFVQFRQYIWNYESIKRILASTILTTEKSQLQRKLPHRSFGICKETKMESIQSWSISSVYCYSYTTRFHQTEETHFYSEYLVLNTCHIVLI